jgi:hypothetical protein
VNDVFSIPSEDADLDVHQREIVGVYHLCLGAKLGHVIDYLSYVGDGIRTKIFYYVLLQVALLSHAENREKIAADDRQQ